MPRDEKLAHHFLLSGLCYKSLFPETQSSSSRGSRGIPRPDVYVCKTYNPLQQVYPGVSFMSDVPKKKKKTQGVTREKF